MTVLTLPQSLRMQGDARLARGDISGGFRLYRLASWLAGGQLPPPPGDCDSSETVTNPGPWRSDCVIL